MALGIGGERRQRDLAMNVETKCFERSWRESVLSAF